MAFHTTKYENRETRVTIESLFSYRQMFLCYYRFTILIRLRDNMAAGPTGLVSLSVNGEGRLQTASRALIT